MFPSHTLTCTCSWAKSDYGTIAILTVIHLATVSVVSCVMSSDCCVMNKWEVQFI